MSETVFVSRFPDRITPGALPILPSVISIHDRHGGGFIVFQWFDGAEPCEIQSVPHFCDTLTEAYESVPRTYVPIPCPEDFGLMMYQLPGGEPDAK